MSLTDMVVEFYVMLGISLDCKSRYTHLTHSSSIRTFNGLA